VAFGALWERTELCFLFLEEEVQRIDQKIIGAVGRGHFRGV